MVPTDDALITLQMLYSALPVPATAVFAITSSIHAKFLVPDMHFDLQSQALHGLENPSPGLADSTEPTHGLVNFSAQRPSQKWSWLLFLQDCCYRQFCSG
jgi:hypothetical protein